MGCPAGKVEGRTFHSMREWNSVFDKMAGYGLDGQTIWRDVPGKTAADGLNMTSILCALWLFRFLG